MSLRRTSLTVRYCSSLRPPLQDGGNNLQSRHPKLFRSLQESSSMESIMSVWRESQHLLLSSDHFEVLQRATYNAKDRKMIRTLLQDDCDFRNLYKKVTDGIETLSTANVVMLLWLIAYYRHKDKPTLRKITNALENCHTFSQTSEKSLGLVMWSLGILNYTESIRLVEKIGDITVRRLTGEGFRNHRALANICWTLALMEKWPEGLTNLLTTYLLSNRKWIKERPFAILTWAIQRVDPPCEKSLIEKGSEIVLRRDTDPHIVSLLMWTLGKSQFYNESFYDRLSELVITGNVRNWYNPRLLSHLLWCLGRVRYYNPLLMDRLAEMVLPQIEFMEAQDLSNAVHCYGFFNHKSPAIMEAAVKRILELSRRHFNCQSIMNISWSCLVMEMYPQKLMELCFSRDMKEGITSYERERESGETLTVYGRERESIL